MKLGPSDSNDLFCLNAAHESYSKLEKLRQEVRLAETEFQKKCRFVGYKIKNSFFAQDKKMLSVEDYLNLKNDPSPEGYCSCKNCRNGYPCD